jgi:diaminopimelate decarboxylase
MLLPLAYMHLTWLLQTCVLPGVDTGFNSLIRPILYAAHHQIVNLSRLHSTPGGPSITAEIVGNICESGDGA